ncbi:hypothetical protein L218DRAFT_1082410 [Marasmius fiardii PR-910]|nr:hypothetical protein L218DRAFT_1082410 [Marasmius fiardii PR-910]
MSLIPSTTSAASSCGSNLEHYNPPTKFETFNDGIPVANAQPFSTEEGLKSNVVNWISSYLQINSSNVEWTSGYTMDTGVSVGYVRQSYNGVPFVNAVANVAFKDSKATSFGSSFVPFNTSNFASSTPNITSSIATSSAETKCGGKHSDGIEPSLHYLPRPDGSASLVYSVRMETPDTGDLFEAYVDASSGEVLSTTDFVSD